MSATVRPRSLACSTADDSAQGLRSSRRSISYHTADVDGLSIFYREAGLTDAPTVFLLHGFPSSSRMWEPLLPLLVDKYHLIAPDYPGFGNSSAPSPSDFEYTFDNLARVMNALTTKLGIAKCVLFMQDYGGPVGFRMALSHPERVRTIIVQNAVAHEQGLSSLWDARRKYWTDPVLELETLKANFTSFEATRQRHLGSSPHPDRYNPDAWTDEYAYLTRPGQADIQTTLFLDYRNNVASYPLWQKWLREMQPPTLVVWGKYDPSFTIAGATAYADDVPKAEIHILEAGHFALDEATDEVASLVRNFLERFEGGCIMLKHIRAAISSILTAAFLSIAGTQTAAAGSKLPDPTKAGFIERLYRLDCGHSLANDESVWTPGENIGRSIEFSSTCWLLKRGNEWLLWDTGVPEATLNDPKGWSTLPKLIVYHLDKTITGQLADNGLKTSDITYVALSHTHGDHIGNVRIFPNSTILMQRAEYDWISSPDGTNDNVKQLKALARELLGTPKHLQLVDGDTDVFGDGSVTLVSTPGHTPGSQSLLVHLKNSGFIILSGDVVHLEENFEKNIVPSLNTDKAAPIASMDKVRRMVATYQAKLFINHDKVESDKLKLLPAFYD